MKIPTSTLPLLLASLGFSTLIVSCAKKDDVEPEPIVQPVAEQPAPAPVVDTSLVDDFRTPEGDLNLPTEAQTAEGADSSIGTGSQPVTNPDNKPSIAISPPVNPASPVTPKAPVTPTDPAPPKKEDQLDPE